MKQNSKVLDVAYIGGGWALTKEDEKAISDFLQAGKHKKAKSKTRLSSRKNAKGTVKVKA